MKTVSVALGDGDSHVDIVIGNIDVIPVDLLPCLEDLSDRIAHGKVVPI